MNSSHGDARRWLEHVLGEDGVPDYQITKVSLELLERLRRKCGEAAHMESRLRLLKELDIVELEAETKRVVNIIERSGERFPLFQVIIPSFSNAISKYKGDSI